MARRLTTGFELGELIEHNGSVNGAGIGTVIVGAARTGGYGWSVYCTAGAYYYFTQVLSDNPAELYVRLALKPITIGPAASDLCGIIAFCDSATPQIAIGLRQSDSRLVIVRGGSGPFGEDSGTQVATGSAVLTTGTWWVIEIYVKLHGSAGQVTMKVNGVTDASFSGATTATANNYADVIRIGFGGATQTCQAYLDDLAINDVSGANQNSWIGRGGVYLLRPTGDGASSQWTGSAGGAHYALVDDVPDNAATDYIYDDVLGHLDLFTLGDLAAEVTWVDLLEPLFQAALAEAGSNSVKHVIRHSGVNYGNETEVIATVTPSFALYKGSPVYEVLGSSGAWTPAQVNALESGVEVA